MIKQTEQNDLRLFNTHDHNYKSSALVYSQYDDEIVGGPASYPNKYKNLYFCDRKNYIIKFRFTNPKLLNIINEK
jgi:hypothetical protein